MSVHRVQIEMTNPRPSRPGSNSETRYRVTYNDCELGTWRVPECSAARQLLSEGIAHINDTLETFSGDKRRMTGRVGWFAVRTVREDAGTGTPRFVKWIPRPESSFPSRGPTQNTPSDDEEAE
jgi:hypothetical protein